MAFSGRQTVALQKYGLPGKVPGPFIRPLHRIPKLFILTASRLSAFALNAARTFGFTVPADRTTIIRGKI